MRPLPFPLPLFGPSFSLVGSGVTIHVIRPFASNPQFEFSKPSEASASPALPTSVRSSWCGAQIAANVVGQCGLEYYNFSAIEFENVILSLLFTPYSCLQSSLDERKSLLQNPCHCNRYYE